LIKYVNSGGNITQNHSGFIIRKATVPAKDKIVYIQYNLTDSVDDVISFLIFVSLNENLQGKSKSFITDIIQKCHNFDANQKFFLF